MNFGMEGSRAFIVNMCEQSMIKRMVLDAPIREAVSRFIVAFATNTKIDIYLKTST